MSFKIDVIILSYNDFRIINAINSVIKNDKFNLTRIIVVDGLSDQCLKIEIESVLRSQDILIYEKDSGIFDALNKGLDYSSSPYIGWLGSDDYFTDSVDFQKVIDSLTTHDLYIGKLYYINKNFITRSVEIWPLKYNLFWLGFNNPHFSTFGKSTLFKSFRFDLSLRGADIKYFNHIFSTRPYVFYDDNVIVHMNEGGFSNSSVKGIFKTHFQLIPIYGYMSSLFLIPFKFIYKFINKFYWKFKSAHI